MALVDDDEPVPVEDGRIVATGQALEHRNVDNARWRVLAAADVTDLLRLQAEVLGES